MLVPGFRRCNVCFTSFLTLGCCLFDRWKVQASSGLPRDIRVAQVTWFLIEKVAQFVTWPLQICFSKSVWPVCLLQIVIDGDGTWCFLDMAHLGSWKMLQSNWNLCRSRWRTGQRSLQPPPDSLQREKAPPRPTRLRHFLKQRKLRRFGVSSDLRPTSATVFKLSIEIW